MAVPEGWELPQAIRGRLGERMGRQRAMAAEGHLLLLLHEPIDLVASRPRGVAYWRRPDATWAWSGGSGDGLAALRQLHERYDAQLDAGQRRLDAATDAESLFQAVRTIAPLHRAASNMLGAMQQAREMVPDDRDIIILRDRAGDIDRSVDLLHSDAVHALDYTVARQTEEQARLGYELSRSSYRLNLLAAIFLPITAIGALFGMNLHHGLDARDPALFWGLLVFAVVVGLALHLSLSAHRRMELQARQAESNRKVKLRRSRERVVRDQVRRVELAEAQRHERSG